MNSHTFCVFCSDLCILKIRSCLHDLEVFILGSAAQLSDAICILFTPNSSIHFRAMIAKCSTEWCHISKVISEPTMQAQTKTGVVLSVEEDLFNDERIVG